MLYKDDFLGSFFFSTSLLLLLHIIRLEPTKIMMAMEYLTQATGVLITLTKDATKNLSNSSI
jgi:hypothetical protein